MYVDMDPFARFSLNSITNNYLDTQKNTHMHNQRTHYAQKKERRTKKQQHDVHWKEHSCICRVITLI